MDFFFIVQKKKIHANRLLRFSCVIFYPSKLVYSFSFVIAFKQIAFSVLSQHLSKCISFKRANFQIFSVSLFMQENVYYMSKKMYLETGNRYFRTLHTNKYKGTTKKFGTKNLQSTYHHISLKLRIHTFAFVLVAHFAVECNEIH